MYFLHILAVASSTFRENKHSELITLAFPELFLLYRVCPCNWHAGLKLAILTKHFFSLAALLHKPTSGCAIVNNGSCSAMNEHTRIVCEVACWISHRGRNVRSGCWSRGLMSRVSFVASVYLFAASCEQHLLRAQRAEARAWYQLPHLPSAPLSSSQAQRHLFFVSLST